MLKIWGRRTSTNVQKVMWLVGELGLPHERVDAGGRYGVVGTDAYGKMNPNRRVPTVEDDGLVMWESNSILRYIAAKYAAPLPFWPDDPAARAHSERWMDWQLGTFGPAFAGMFTNFYRTKAAERDWPAIKSGHARTAQLLKLLDAHMANRSFIAGDTIGLGDIATGVVLFRLFKVGEDFPELKWPDVPNLTAWYKRLCERPAYREHVMVPYDELFEDGIK